MDTLPLRILIVDDEANIRLTLAMCLQSDGHTVAAHGTMPAALEELSRQAFDLIFLDVRLDSDNGLAHLPQIQARNPWAKIVVITAYASVATALEAMKGGAADYLPKPFTPAQVRLVVEKVTAVLRMERKIDALQQALGALDPESDFPTSSAEMELALETARRAASSQATVLICGETGTGKGRLARAIHAWSTRAAAPVGVTLCQTKSAELLDLELFGAVAATDATAAVAGRVAACDGGTLILEEVGDIPPSLQPKVVHLLTDKEYEPIHDFRSRPANVRVIATSSIDLTAAEKQRRFRPELLLALDVVRVVLPPLRDRPQDVRLLAARYLAFFGRENHRRIAGFTPDALRVLARYPWPGNARELRNIVERAVLLCRGEEIGVEHFPPDLLRCESAYGLGDFVALETIEQVHARRVIDSTGSIKGAAAILGVNEKTLRRWLKRQPPAAGPVPAAVT